MRPKVKICGLQKPVDAQYVNDAGADYAGFVFYEKSKRNVSCQKAKKNYGKNPSGYKESCRDCFSGCSTDSNTATDEI